MTSAWTRHASALLERGATSIVIGDAALVTTNLDGLASPLPDLGDFIQEQKDAQAQFVLLHAETVDLQIRRETRKELPGVVFLRNSTLVNRSLSNELYNKTLYAAMTDAAALQTGLTIHFLAKDMIETKSILQSLADADILFELHAFENAMRVSYTV